MPACANQQEHDSSNTFQLSGILHAAYNKKYMYFFSTCLKGTECTTNPKRPFSEVQYLFRRLKNLQFAFSQTNQLKKVLLDLKGYKLL